MAVAYRRPFACFTLQGVDINSMSLQFENETRRSIITSIVLGIPTVKPREVAVLRSTLHEGSFVMGVTMRRRMYNY